MTPTRSPASRAPSPSESARCLPPLSVLPAYAHFPHWQLSGAYSNVGSDSETATARVTRRGKMQNSTSSFHHRTPPPPTQAGGATTSSSSGPGGTSKFKFKFFKGQRALTVGQPPSPTRNFGEFTSPSSSSSDMNSLPVLLCYSSDGLLSLRLVVASESA